jgi:hypothetical protein
MAVLARPMPAYTASLDRPAPLRAGWVARYGRGRVCVALGCTTNLSVYNADLYCWTHQRPVPKPGLALRS